MRAPPTREAFTAKERQIVERRRTPGLVQRWLDSVPYNAEPDGETLRTFRGVVRAGAAHCLEGALSAATILEQHGYPPLLLDLESVDDLDHVAFLFRRGDRWGCVAKSREPGLGGRKPAFRTVDALVRTFFNPYIDERARITGYGVFDLRTSTRVDWRLSAGNVWSVERTLIDMPHRALRVSERRYRMWRERYLRYKGRHPDGEPAYFPGRRWWL